jgi:hypothetical protein
MISQTGLVKQVQCPKCTQTCIATCPPLTPLKTQMGCFDHAMHVWLARQEFSSVQMDSVRLPDLSNASCVNISSGKPMWKTAPFRSADGFFKKEYLRREFSILDTISFSGSVES